MFLGQNNNELDITNGLKADVITMIDNAIKNNSIESFYEIDRFVVKILNLSISNKYLPHFKEYIDICIYYYIYSYGKDVSYNKIFDVCSDLAARRIKETFFSINAYEKSNLFDMETINKFKLCAFTTFSQLLYEQVKRKDLKQFTYTLNQLEQVETFGSQFDKYDFSINFEVSKLRIKRL